MHDTAILHDSCVLYQCNFLDHELNHFPCTVVCHESNVAFRHKISRCQMQCSTFMLANQHDSLFILQCII